MQPQTEAKTTPELPPLRILAGSAVGIALANGVAAQPAPPPAPTEAAVQLPPIAVQAQDGQGGLPKRRPVAVQADAAAGRYPAVDHRDPAAVDGGSGRHRGTRSAAQCPRHQPGRGRGRRSGRQSHTAGIQRAQRLLPRRHARLRQLLPRSVQPERDRGTEGPGLDPVRSWFHRRRDQPGQQAAAARADHGGHGDGRHRSDVPLHHRYRPAHRGRGRTRRSAST